MKLASFFWTIIFSIGIFFAVVYFGIKDNTANQGKSRAASQVASDKDTTGTLDLPVANTVWREKHSPYQSNNEFWEGSERKPVLLEEEPIPTYQSVTEMPEPTLTDQQQQPDSMQADAYQIKLQCSDYLINLGISGDYFDQALQECIATNMVKVVTPPSYEQQATPSTAVQTTAFADMSDEDQFFRQQCENAIDQPELLSQADITMLVKQCVETLKE